MQKPGIWEGSGRSLPKQGHKILKVVKAHRSSRFDTKMIMLRIGGKNLLANVCKWRCIVKTNCTCNTPFSVITFARHLLKTNFSHRVVRSLKLFLSTQKLYTETAINYKTRRTSRLWTPFCKFKLQLTYKIGYGISLTDQSKEAGTGYVCNAHRSKSSLVLNDDRQIIFEQL